MKRINLQQRSLKNKLKELKQKRLKVGERKGITLIALVITIIVLLILAGVSIAVLTGENGILKKANEAKDKTQIADVKEQAQMDILAEQMKNEGGNISAEKLKEILEKYFDSVPDADKLEEELKKEDGLKLKSKAQYGGQEIDIADIYSGEFEKGAITADQLDSELQQSTKVQYVTNYGIDIDGDGDSTYDWEIFYIEDYEGEDNAKNGNQQATGKRIFLIASDYVRKDTKALQTAVGREKASMSNGSGESEDYCKYWSSSNIPAYHCTLPNEEGSACTFPKLFEFSNYDIKTHNSNSNSKCAASLLCTGNWSSFVKSEYADYATGGPSLEMWVDSWNKRHGSEKQLYYSDKEQNSSTGYYVGTNTKPNNTSVYGLGNSDPLYFPHKSKTDDFDGDGDEEYCYGYWLASPSAINSSIMMYVNCSGIVNSNSYNDASVRFASGSLSKI